MTREDEIYLTREEKRAKRRAEKEAKARLAQDDAVIQSLMAREPGRDYVNDLLAECGVFSTTFMGAALGSAYNEGRRSIGLRLLGDIIRATPEAYLLMLKENASAGRSQPELPHDKLDPDDERNWDAAGRWIGDGLEPDPEADQ